MSALTGLSAGPSAIAPARRIRMLPLAITAEDATTGCIAGIDSLGNWVRPQPIPLAFARDPQGPFRYGRWTQITARPQETAARPEDMALVGDPEPGPALPPDELAALIRTHSSATVDEGFAERRSAAIIPARIDDLHARRHTRGRVFLRLVFRDASGERFDWILPEVATVARFADARRGDGLDTARVSAWLDELAGADVHLAIGLTLASRPAGDRFKGCQPLAVGLHALPRADRSQVPERP
jgi:hypothetical protein